MRFSNQRDWSRLTISNGYYDATTALEIHTIPQKKSHRSQDAAGPTQSYRTQPRRVGEPTATSSTRAFRTVPPQELTDAAHKAARLTDTDAHIVHSSTPHVERAAATQ